MDYNDNTYWLYRPSPAFIGCSACKKSPVIIEFFGSAWNAQGTGPFSFTTPAIAKYNDHGFAFVSTGYRLINREYFFLDSDGGTISREELIKVSPDGVLSLDQNGRTIYDYKATIGYLELITKCFFDVTRSLEHVILHADEFGLDVHRIVFIGSSAGSAPANYLSFIYHQWNVPRFSPVGMILSNPQLNLPVMPIVGQLWQDFVEHMEEGTLISSLMPFQRCKQFLQCPDAGQWDITFNPNDGRVMGNFSTSNVASVCNKTWNAVTVNRYCSSSALYNVTTVAQVSITQIWDESRSEFGKGLETLWYVSKSMLRHQPRPFHIFVAWDAFVEPDFLHDFLHHPMYVQEMAEVADKVGIDYTVFFGQYQGMRPNPCSKMQRVSESEIVPPRFYASSRGWREKYPAVKAFNLDFYSQHLPFLCLVAGMMTCPGLLATNRSSSHVYLLALSCFGSCLTVGVCTWIYRRQVRTMCTHSTADDYNDHDSAEESAEE